MRYRGTLGIWTALVVATPACSLLIDPPEVDGEAGLIDRDTGSLAPKSTGTTGQAGSTSGGGEGGGGGGADGNDTAGSGGNSDSDAGNSDSDAGNSDSDAGNSDSDASDSDSDAGDSDGESDAGDSDGESDAGDSDGESDAGDIDIDAGNRESDASNDSGIETDIAGIDDAGVVCSQGEVRFCALGGALGVCAGGAQTCVDVSWSACSVQPGVEFCADDGQDEDCDGEVNESESCACTNGETRSCAEGGLVGPCSEGEQVCSTGIWGDCSVEPAQYDGCTAADDSNCDGNVNSPLNPSCVCVQGDTDSCGACNNGLKTCAASGDWGGCAGGGAVTYYRDEDGDGYGNDSDSVTACSAQSGYVTQGGDCCDIDADAHPGQTAWFDWRSSFDEWDGSRCGSWDYDCDGVGAKKYTDVVDESLGCPEEGWHLLVPNCNTGGGWVTPSCDDGDCVCRSGPYPYRDQQCR